MRRPCFLTALGFAVGLASCGVPPPQSPTKGFQITGERVTSLTQGFFRLPRPSDRSCLQRLVRHLPPGAASGLTPCTVTGNVTFLVGALQQTAQLFVDVTQPTTGAPSGTVIFNQTITEPFGLRSSSITSVVCGVDSATITGTLFGGGNFLLAIYPTANFLTDTIEFVTPYYVAGGPVIEGSLVIDAPLGEVGSKPGKLKSQPVGCPPLRHELNAAGPPL